MTLGSWSTLLVYLGPPRLFTTSPETSPKPFLLNPCHVSSLGDVPEMLHLSETYRQSPTFRLLFPERSPDPSANLLTTSLATCSAHCDYTARRMR
jgi:hypothetical protein